MLLQFATKRNANGNRKYLAFDTSRKTFALSPRGWYSREDVVEITAKDRLKIIDAVLNEGYKQVDTL